MSDSDTYLRQGDGGLFRVEAGQQHAFQCECGKVHLMAFALELDAIVVTITGDRRLRLGRMLRRAMLNILPTTWPRR